MASVAVSKAIHLGKPALRVTWTTPQSDVIISQYQVVYRIQGTNSLRKVDIRDSVTSTLLEALVAGTAYEVHISAVSAIGNGPWSEVVSETTYMRELRSEFKQVETTHFEVCSVVTIGKTAVEYPSYCCKELLQKGTQLNWRLVNRFYIKQVA